MKWNKTKNYPTNGRPILLEIEGDCQENVYVSGFYHNDNKCYCDDVNIRQLYDTEVKRWADLESNALEDGIWYSVQFLVCSHDETTLAAFLCKEANLSKNDCRILQAKTEFENEKMMAFINNEIK